jgi:putative restriction endonuclease
MDQRIFRRVLLKTYSGKCCICGLSIEELLEAAHIKPYQECTADEKISVNNGLLLCANHHKLFDNEILKISKEYKIMINNIDETNESNRKFISVYNGHTINLPKDFLHYPNKNFFD